jgi:hypothetical protein
MMHTRTCRDCGAPMVFLRGGPNRWIPVDEDSVTEGDEVFEPRSGHVPHVETCQAEEMRRRDAKGG